MLIQVVLSLYLSAALPRDKGLIFSWVKLAHAQSSHSHASTDVHWQQRDKQSQRCHYPWSVHIHSHVYLTTHKGSESLKRHGVFSSLHSFCVHDLWRTNNYSDEGERFKKAEILQQDENHLHLIWQFAVREMPQKCGNKSGHIVLNFTQHMHTLCFIGYD